MGETNQDYLRVAFLRLIFSWGSSKQVLSLIDKLPPPQKEILGSNTFVKGTSRSWSLLSIALCLHQSWHTV